MHRKVISMIVAFSLVYGTTIPAIAAPLNDTLKQQQSQLNSNKNSLKQVQDKRQKIETQIQILDSQIESVMLKMNEINKKVKKLEDDIKDTEEQIKKAQKDIEKEQNLYNKRVRAMYVNGTDTYIEVILNSESFSDLISRIDTVKQVIEYDKDLMESLNNKKTAVENKKKELNKEKDTLVNLKEENKQQLDVLNSKKAEQSKMIDEIRKEEEKYNSQITGNQKLIDQTMSKIRAMQRQATTSNSSSKSYTPSRGVSNISSISSSGIVAYASNFLGTPYVWGGTSPSGFDCSGFVQYVYSHFGVQLPRVAASQAGVGTTVSQSELQPGDLVFFAYGSGYVHHVGIYVGNGCYIHAPHTGDVVKISPLSGSDFVYGKRI